MSAQKGVAVARAVRFVANANPGVPPSVQPLTTTPAQLSLAVTDALHPQAFTVTFTRSLFSPSARVWLFDVAQGGRTFWFAPAPASENRWVSPQLDTAQRFDETFTRLPAPPAALPATARIAGVEIANAP